MATVGTGQSEYGDAGGASLFEGGGGGASGSAGGKHVVHQQDLLPLDGLRLAAGEGATGIDAPLGTGETGLGGDGSGAPQGVQQGESGVVGDSAGEQFSLVVAAQPLAEPVHGHGDDGIEGDAEGQSGDDHAPQRLSQLPNASILEHVDEVTDLAVVDGVGEGGVVLRQTEAAEGAPTQSVERIGV